MQTIGIPAELHRQHRGQVNASALGAGREAAAAVSAKARSNNFLRINSSLLGVREICPLQQGCSYPPSGETRTAPGSSVTKSLPKARDGVQAPGETRPAAARNAASTAETAVKA